MASDDGGRDGPVLVTGATGFIGRSLCASFAEAGRDVHAVVRQSSQRRAPDDARVIRHVVHDASAEIDELVASLQPGVVFHLATHFAPRHSAAEIPRMIEANVTFGTAVIDAATRAGAHLVYATSAWQHYGSAEYSPVSLYAATKQALADIIAYFTEVEGLRATDVCLFDTYGPGDDRKKLMWTLLEHAATGRPLPMSSGRQLVDLTHIDDVVSALHDAAATPGVIGRRVVRSGMPLTVRQLVALVERVTARTIDARWDALEARPREMYEDWLVGGIATSWRPRVALESGIAQLWNERANLNG